MRKLAAGSLGLAPGGATAATVDTIQHEEQWSPAGIGCLSSGEGWGPWLGAMVVGQYAPANMVNIYC